MIEMFKKFMADPNGWDMYVTGQAGTGKTTDLCESVQYCMDNEINYVICAFTHKACGILRTKMPQGAHIQTLHKFLKKRPSINQSATKVAHVQSSVKSGDSDEVSVMFIDEYSMVGERDLMDIRAAQDEDYDGNPELRVVWLGDPNQLPPVKDQQTVKPSGEYCLTLTKVYRQALDNPLMAPLNQLVSFIQGAPAEPLIESDKLVRGQDIVEWYDNDRMSDDHDGIMLAFTNKRVQELNAEAQGRTEPILLDTVFSPNTRESYTFDGVMPNEEVSHIELPYGDNLSLGSKYKTLEHLVQNLNYQFVNLIDDDGDTRIYCSIFGHYEYKKFAEHLMQEAVSSNKAIETKHPGHSAAGWAKANYKSPLARARAKAWRDYLSFNECCICLDFKHAMTVHKSQGSTYNTIYLDTQDLGIAADIDYTVYLKLMYVALSRASNMVVTN